MSRVSSIAGQWFRIQAEGGLYSWDGMLVLDGRSIAVSRWTRKTTRGQWKLVWEEVLPIDRGRVVGMSRYGMVDKLYVNELYRGILASVRENPSPGDNWTEIVEYKNLLEGDHVRGGPRKIVWSLKWIDAPLTVPDGTRAQSWNMVRVLSGLQFNERMLGTQFAETSATMIKIGWATWGVHSQNKITFYGDDIRHLDDDQLRKLGPSGFMVLQKMMERLHEIEAGLPKPKKRTGKP